MIGLLIIVILAYVVLKDGKGFNFEKQNKDTSIEMLKLRYINGEIDEETYTKMLKIIKD